MLWHQKVLDKFNLDSSQLVLVADPDGILQEESILGYLSGKGFEMLEYSDPVAFRYIFEEDFRGQKGRKLIVQVYGKRLEVLPYDILNMGVSVDLNLADFFPKLSYPVLRQLEPGVIGQLYQAYSEYDGGLLGDQGTREFVLRRIYELVPELIQNKVQFLRTLLSLHYRNVQLPMALTDYILGKLQGREFLKALKGESLMKRREEFWNFLQGQWQLFIKDEIAGTNQALVPFAHDEIKVYMDNLFIEGYLSPISVAAGAEKLPEWVKVGLKGFEEANREHRLLQLIGKLEAILEQENLSYQHWLKLAPVLGEAKIINYGYKESLTQEVGARFSEVYKQLDALFKEWLYYKYGTLSNLSYIKSPVMVHHIPRFMSYQGRKHSWQKLALVVLDGLAWDQWVLMKQHLLEDYFKLEESAAFAWVPTMTSVSRQAIFAGEPPRYFKDSMLTTSKEEKLWKRFWENEGFKAFNISLIKGLGEKNSNTLEPVLANPKLKVLGLVVDKVDKMVHGQQLGTRGMHQDIELWMQEGYLKALLDSLLEKDFKVFLTSDHGNVAAIGQGKLDQGVLVDSKGERFRTYQDQAFLTEAKEKTNSMEWPNKFGLPEDIHILLAEAQTAYVAEGKNIVSHGGISMEEVVVPFIRIWKDEQH